MDGPRQSQRVKGGNQYIQSASQHVARHAHPSNGSSQFNSRKIPLVPVVVENNGNNFHSLQQVLSLLNQGGIVHHTRVARSADHHPDHHGHDHHDHHGHHDHQMNKTESSSKSQATNVFGSIGKSVVHVYTFLFFKNSTFSPSVIRTFNDSQK
ncbi:hypothetical protein CEXT_170341 [Caerostris extrusa]|uniref:Uncharacterized protein n=1 Tax=Caerostris extrusa TaxID=172846 RepID=A0AAV4M773_CAEEX|nr:hypothetical protein CEXT_170341 [Caerostris extrusa]